MREWEEGRMEDIEGSSRWCHWVVRMSWEVGSGAAAVNSGTEAVQESEGAGTAVLILIGLGRFEGVCEVDPSVLAVERGVTRAGSSAAA